MPRQLARLRRPCARISMILATTALGAGIARASTPLLNDDFSIYSPGNLVGQNGWTQLGSTVNSLPIQLSGGQVQIPAIAAGAAGAADNQDAYKNFLSTVPVPASGTSSVYATLTLNISAAQSNAAYFFALSDTSTGFANFRVTAKDNNSTIPNTYLLGGRVNGQAGYPFAYGAALTYGTTHTLVIEADSVAGNANDVMKLFVDPASTDPADVAGATPYATATYNTGTVADPAGFGVAILSQFASATTGQDGVSLSSLDIVATPEPTSLTLLAPAALLLKRRRILVA